MADDFDLFMATMVCHPVSVTEELVADLARSRYGLDVITVERLTGERDENFKIGCADGSAYVFKIANAVEDPLVTDLPAAALLHVEKTAPALPCPRVCSSRVGESQIRIRDQAGRDRTARMVTYLPGTPLELAPRSREQRAACGRACARLGHALLSFEHRASHRALVWDLRNLPKLGKLLPSVPALPHADFMGEFLDRFSCEVAPRLTNLRRQFIHNDFNDRNILVDPKDAYIVTGIIDFGDAVHTALIADVAIAAAAQITGLDTAEQSVADLVLAYHEVEPLLASELEILNWLIAGRIVAGVLIPSWHRIRNPGTTHYESFDREHIERRIALAKRLMSTRIAVP